MIRELDDTIGLNLKYDRRINPQPPKKKVNKNLECKYTAHCTLNCLGCRALK